MSLISAKNLLCLLAFTSLLLTCSREGDEPLWEPETHLGSKDYNGGIFLVWIKLKEPIPVDKLSSITWRAGKNAQIAKRKQELNSANDKIIADTAYFHWETPPEPTQITECVQVGDNCEERTRNIYLDTIFAIVNGVESAPIVIEIKNILPKVISLKVGGLTQPGDSTLIIAAHPGDWFEIELRLEKAFNKDNSPRVEMPLNGTLTEKQRSDSLWSWEWRAPNDTMDAIIKLKIGDSRASGERIYDIHLISYYEFGSVWVASDTAIAKFSPNGSQVLSIRDGKYSYISDIAVHSNPRVPSSEKLFVVDQYKNTLSIYDAYGTRIYRDSTSLKNPTSVAVDIEGLYVWIADSLAVVSSSSSGLRPSSNSGLESSSSSSFGYRFRLRAFDFASGTLGGVAHEFKFSGAIRGLSTDKYDRTRLWFTLPEIDTVGFVRYNLSTGDSKVRYIKPSKSKWNRPSMVSLDPINGLAWVADSSRIVAVMESNKEDENGVIIGEEKAIVEGFGFVSAVSASENAVWASDILNGKVYKYNGPFRGEPSDLDKFARSGTEVQAADNSGYSQPSYVSAFWADGSAWVMDLGKGRAVKVDNLGRRMFTGPNAGIGGLSPRIGKAIQKVE